MHILRFLNCALTRECCRSERGLNGVREFVRRYVRGARAPYAVPHPSRRLKSRLTGKYGLQETCSSCRGFYIAYTVSLNVLQPHRVGLNKGSQGPRSSERPERQESARAKSASSLLLSLLSGFACPHARVSSGRSSYSLNSPAALVLGCILL